MKMNNEFHKEIAVECYNNTWDLIDKKERTEEEKLKMIHMAHTSRYHWGVIGKPVNFQRGEWQIARVYSELKMIDQAIYHAEICLELSLINSLDELDIAFAYEAMTRAYSLAENKELYEENKKLAIEHGNKIENKENREYFLKEINSL
ncbi:hypothetical protein QUF55_04645 [Clostridiaceae bacterium HSG29]|nr:hypothetical protein [Clostridiaceae bacterium HSG29]